MGDALSLDHETVAAQTAVVVADPWLARRRHGWGASEVPALLLAYDHRDDEARTARRYHLEDAEVTRRGNVPRIVARKAGLLASVRLSRAMSEGARRERELVETWARECGFDGVTMADAMPREFLPLRDDECPRLTATPDAWCRGPSDELIAVEAKCTFDHPSECAWYWRAQTQAQMACMSAAAAVLVCGPGWVRGEDTRPVSWLIERDEREIARIRDVCVRAWADVERVRQ
ncbi:MAG: hypothetical protein IPK80_02470 [Nannocystis sp.]|nr:hypothetical protein [Nannocystis sp.]